MEDKEYYIEIGFIRFCAMLLIICCHIMQHYGNELAYWFNVGVQIFLFMSGWLHGNKKIANGVEWTIKKFQKILIDYWVLLMVIIPIYWNFARQYINLSSIFKLFFARTTISGLGHLWYINCILSCYLLVPILYRLGEKWGQIPDSTKIIRWIGLLCIIHILFYLYLPIEGTWVNCFILGFICRRYLCGGVPDLTIWIPIIILNGWKIYINYFAEYAWESSAFWDIASKYIHVCLGIGLFSLLYYVCNFMINHVRNDVFEWISNTVLKWSDKYSYDIYLVHHVYVLSPFALYELTTWRTMNYFLIAFCIISSAMLLHWISAGIRNKLVLRWE